MQRLSNEFDETFRRKTAKLFKHLCEQNFSTYIINVIEYICYALALNMHLSGQKKSNNINKKYQQS